MTDVQATAMIQVLADILEENRSFHRKASQSLTNIEFVVAMMKDTVDKLGRTCIDGRVVALRVKSYSERVSHPVELRRLKLIRSVDTQPPR